MAKIIKILAEGSYKTFITIQTKEGNKYTLYTTNRKLYKELKKEGIPTAQSLRKKKNK